MKRLTACLMLCLCLAGCGKETKTIDTEALAKELLEAEIFTETLYPVKEDMAKLAVGLPEDASFTGAIYMGTAATAEELVVIKAADEETADSYKEALTAHLETRKEQYSAYLPQEAYKLENAILTQWGDSLVLCIAEDFETAEEMIGSYTK